MSMKIGFGINNNALSGFTKEAEGLWIRRNQLSGEELKAAIAKIEAKKAPVIPAGSAEKLDKQA